MKNVIIPIAIALLFSSWSCKQRNSTAEAERATGPHIVFVIGDEEYRSEESMPMLAQLAKRELNARVSLCFSVDSAGYIDPNRLDHIQGLEALETADLMVMFTRFRQLPPAQLKYISDYVESGRPAVGFRTSTHAFLYPEGSPMVAMNNDWPTRVFGQQWITHHGHFDDGARPLTRVNRPSNIEHEILSGIQSFDAYSWLYHVDGGDWTLAGDSKPLLFGRSLKSIHEMEGRLAKFPLENPVAWTKTYRGSSGKLSRIFFTTLGHPYDWKDENMRRLALNGLAWALDISPIRSYAVEYASPYEPNNSGFGTKFKPGLRPEQFTEIKALPAE